MFRLCVHVLNVLNSTYSTKYPDDSNVQPDEVITVKHTDDEKAKLFFKYFWSCKAEVLDPDILLLEWAVDNPEYLGRYFAWSMYSFRYYKSVEEAQKHIAYLTQILMILNERMCSISPEQQVRFVKSLLSFFWGSVNPSVYSDLKDYQIEKMRLLEKCADILEPSLKELPAFTKKAKALRRVGVLRYAYEHTEEVIQIKKSFSDLEGKGAELVWIILDSPSGIRESSENGEAFYHLPLNEFSKSIEFLRGLNLDLLVLTSPTSGKFFSEAAIIVQKRVAPIQTTMVANVVTPGIKNLDGFTFGDVYDRRRIEDQVAEKPWIIPGFGSRIHLSHDGENPRFQLEDPGLAVHFVSNAHVLKLGPEILEVWMRILAKVPDSKLILMPFGNDAALSFKTAFLSALKQIREKHKVDKRRIIIHHRVSGTAAVIEVLKQGDIYLDTFPYSGSTSLFDAISLGMPMVSCDHTYFRGMMGAAILRHIGLSSYVVNSDEDYIKLCVQLATDPEIFKKAKKDAKQARENVLYRLDQSFDEGIFNALKTQYNEYI